MKNPRWKVRPEGSNWGDFGADDQQGRMNLLTPENIMRGVREVKMGKSFCLSLPLDYPGGNALFEHRREFEYVYSKRGEGHNFNYQLSGIGEHFTDIISDDAVLLYTQYSTQWDGLGHVGQKFDVNGDGNLEKVYYNGYKAGVDVIGPDDADKDFGAKRIGIENMAITGVQGRGVMVDLERVYGRERKLVGYDELMSIMNQQNIEVFKGDFLCLYTGFADLILEMNKKPDGAVLANSCAVLDGRDQKLLQWITDSGIVAICSDNFAVEAYPAREGQGDLYPALPLHAHCIFKLGMHLGELWYYHELVKWLRANNRNSYLLTAPPLRLTGAVGSPVTPIATV